MKKTALCLLFSAILALSILPGCVKDDDDNDTTTPPPQKTLEEVLISRPWRMEELRFLQNNTFYYYKRGASGNSLNFDSDVITFNANKTGTYVGGNGTFSLTWDFTDGTKTKIAFTLNYATPIVVNMENITFTETTLKYTEYYTYNGWKTLAVVSRIP